MPIGESVDSRLLTEVVIRNHGPGESHFAATLIVQSCDAGGLQINAIFRDVLTATDALSSFPSLMPADMHQPLGVIGNNHPVAAGVLGCKERLIRPIEKCLGRVVRGEIRQATAYRHVKCILAALLVNGGKFRPQVIENTKASFGI